MLTATKKGSMVCLWQSTSVFEQGQVWGLCTDPLYIDRRTAQCWRITSSPAVNDISFSISLQLARRIYISEEFKSMLTTSSHVKQQSLVIVLFHQKPRSVFQMTWMWAIKPAAVGYSISGIQEENKCTKDEVRGYIQHRTNKPLLTHWYPNCLWL